MPRRNLLLILAIAAVSLLCYRRAESGSFVGALAEAFSLIRRNYIHELDRTQQREVFEAAVSGMVESLGDRDSMYLSPDEYGQLREQSIDMSFDGIGVHIDTTAEPITVLAPIIGGPAMRVGMQPGDRIVKVDGADVEDMEIAEAVRRIKGRRGTIVELTVLRPDVEEPLVFQVQRGPVAIESVVGHSRDEQGKWRYYLPDDPRIRYVHLTAFGKGTSEKLRSAIVPPDGNVKALILDLRNNHGGMLDQAVSVADLFLDGEMIVSVRGRTRLHSNHYAKSSGTLTGFPIAVLIDGGSASASEIVAAALQDHGRAAVVGSQSYGKGSVQELLPLEGGRSRLKLTTALYWRPSGQNIHRTEQNEDDKSAWGVRPNDGLEVSFTDEQRRQLYQAFRNRDLLGFPAANGEEPFDDIQLKKAEEYLREKLGGK